MTWLQNNWRWLMLNVFGSIVMALLLVQTLAADRFNPNYDLMLISSGKWAIRFLLLSLAMTPLNMLFGWRSAIKLRKPAGLWAFGFGLAHFVLNMIGLGENWVRVPIPDWYAALGIIGLSVLTAMAVTSTKGAMKQLGKWWKRLHRLVYAASLIVVGHALLESSNKRVAGYEPQVAFELGLYLIFLAVLLIVRVRVVRSALLSLQQRQSAGRLSPL